MNNTEIGSTKYLHYMENPANCRFHFSQAKLRKEFMEEVIEKKRINFLYCVMCILVSHDKDTLFLGTFHLIRCHPSNRAELRTRSMVRYYTCISSTRWDVAHLSGTPGEVARMMKRTRISYRESPPPKAMLAPFSKMNQSIYEYMINLAEK